MVLWILLGCLPKVVGLDHNNAESEITVYADADAGNHAYTELGKIGGEAHASALGTSCEELAQEALEELLAETAAKGGTASIETVWWNGGDPLLETSYSASEGSAQALCVRKMGWFLTVYLAWVPLVLPTYRQAVVVGSAVRIDDQ